MTEAYVLINCALGKEESIIQDLANISGISQVHGTFGAYDIITKVAVSYTHLTLPTTPYV